MLRIVSPSGSTANVSIFWCHAESALKMSMPFRLPPKPKAGMPHVPESTAGVAVDVVGPAGVDGEATAAVVVVLQRTNGLLTVLGSAGGSVIPSAATTLVPIDTSSKSVE